MVQVFAKEHLATLAKVTRDEDAVEAGFDYLNRRAKLYFPDYFTITVLDAELRPILDDFDGLVGEVCLADTVKIMASADYQVRIHPNPVAYHFDVVAPWQLKGTKGVFFISFHADFLGRLLKGRQISGYELLLIDKSAGDLIEVTADGARVNWVREDYRLQPAEQRRVLVEVPVAGSRWHVAVMHGPDIFQQEFRRMLLESAAIMSVFIVIICSALLILWRESQRRLQAEQTKDEFISLISHELRTPLTAIRGGVSLIANGVTGEGTSKTLELAKLALSNAEQLNQLVDDLLDMQKLTAGKLEMHKQKTELVSLVERVLQNYKSYADRLTASYHFHAEITAVNVLVDPHRIEQVLANLLSNAVKYGRANDEIEVAVVRHDDRVQVSVTDHGEGIPAEFQPRLFEAFSQSADMREHIIKGTGLGLYIAKAIIQEHNGEIGFNTTPGEGTTFWFDLPRHDDPRVE